MTPSWCHDDVMELSPYVDAVRTDLAAAAAAGGPDVALAAERLATALDPAVRLALMEALAQAAAEISADLPAGTVDLRLAGREPRFVVDVPPPVDTPPSPAAEPADADDGEPSDDQQVRITLRIPESLKTRAEDLAARTGLSLNSWLVHAVRAATRQSAVTIDLDLSSLPFADQPGRRASARHMTGWV